MFKTVSCVPVANRVTFENRGCAKDANRSESGELGLRLGVCFTFLIAVVLFLFLAKERIKKFHRKYKTVYRDAVLTLKILVDFTQVQVSLPTMLPMLDLPKSYRTFLENFSVVNMDILPLLGFNCVVPFPYTSTVLVATLLPIAVIVVTLLLYLCSLRGIQAKLKSMKKEMEHDLLLKLWSIFDFDQSGTLDQTELEHLVKKLSHHNNKKLSPQTIQNMMVDLGGNGNETTKQQFLEAAKVSYDSNTTAKDIQIVLQADSTYSWILKQDSVSHHVGTAVQIMLLFHAPVSAKSFAYFDCRPIGKYAYMHKDYNVECSSEEYKGYMSVALLLMIGFALGVPFVIGGYIFCRRKHLQSPEVIQRVGFLYPRYRPGAEAWDVFELLRKMILTGALILAPGFSRTALSILVGVGVGWLVDCCWLMSFLMPFSFSLLFLKLLIACFRCCCRYCRRRCSSTC